MTDTPNLLTVGQAARHWRARHPLVGARRSQPGVRDGRRVRIPAAWVDELLAKGSR
jgi:hypothetical protein